jgi:parallel beta-helix repeat protein
LYGILVEGSKAVQILDNRVREATFAGIRISRAAANITGNQVTHVSGPYGMGIELANTMSQPPSLIQNNLVADNTREGIILHNAMALIDKNTVMRNGLRGIAVTEMSMATVRGNSIVSNTDAGVYVVDNSMAEILANHVGDVRPGVTGNAFGIQAYYYAEVMLGDNSILVDAPNALVAGYNATIEKGGAP